MIAALDTNVLISGLLFGGVPGGVVEAAIEGLYTLALSPATLGELEGVLLRSKFGLDAETVHTLVREMEAVGMVCYPRKNHAIVADDPADNAVIDCAVEANAQYVVSGDQHLLSLGLAAGIPIVTPAKFRGIIRVPGS